MIYALPPHPAPVPAIVCQEDAPCWTWSTMGNRKRGVVLDNGQRIVVNPCQFRTLTLIGWTDTRRTPKLRGDYTALHARCAR